MTSKHKSTFCHQTAKAKLDFCDHEAATPLFIEVADIHIAISYIHLWKDGSHVFSQGGFLNLNWTSANIMPACCQCNSNGSKMQEMSLHLLNIYIRGRCWHTLPEPILLPLTRSRWSMCLIQSMPALAYVSVLHYLLHTLYINYYNIEHDTAQVLSSFKDSHSWYLFHSVWEVKWAKRNSWSASFLICTVHYTVQTLYIYTYFKLSHS